MGTGAGGMVVVGQGHSSPVSSLVGQLGTWEILPQPHPASPCITLYPTPSLPLLLPNCSRSFSCFPLYRSVSLFLTFTSFFCFHSVSLFFTFSSFFCFLSALPSLFSLYILLFLHLSFLFPFLLSFLLSSLSLSPFHFFFLLPFFTSSFLSLFKNFLAPLLLLICFHFSYFFFLSLFPFCFFHHKTN